MKLGKALPSFALTCLVGAWLGVLALSPAQASEASGAPDCEHFKHEFKYTGENGTTEWPTHCPTCGGTEQSPIDLPAIEPSRLSSAAAEAGTTYTTVPQMTLLNNGHTWQASFPQPGGGGQLKFDGTLYELKQFHVHAPSEHTRQGADFPMEVHLVHVDAAKHIAVIGIFIREGNENPTLAKIWGSVPATVDTEVAVATPELNAEALLPRHRDYQTYEGSLTTPPCSESVRWIFMNDTIEASKAQIDLFKNAMHGATNRPPQKLGNRSIKYGTLTGADQGDAWLHFNEDTHVDLDATSGTSVQLKSTPWTIEAWVRLPREHSSDPAKAWNGNVLYLRSLAGENHLSFGSNNINGFESVYLWVEKPRYVHGVGPSEAVPALWHHFALTLTDSEAKAYRDGEWQGDLLTPDEALGFAALEDIFSAHMIGGSGFVGDIAQVRLYSMALSADTVKRHFLHERSFFPGTTGSEAQPAPLQRDSSADAALLGWWPLNEGSGTVARDHSAHRNDGVIYNADWK